MAGDAAAIDHNVSYKHISKVNVGSDGYLYINVHGNFTGGHGCNQLWYARSKEPLTDERTKALMQLAIASFLSQASVHVWTSGCTSFGYPILVQLQLQQ